MYTVRMLITEAFRKATVRGLTDTPEAEEVAQALETLNMGLDQLTAKQEFSTSKKAVKVAVGKEGYVTITNNPKRIIVSAKKRTGENLVCDTDDLHGLEEGEFVEVFFNGEKRLYTCEVTEIISPYTFALNVPVTIPGITKGWFKLQGQGAEYNIDIISCPPDNIYQVISDNGIKLPELQEQDFYANNDNRSYSWYFYDKSRNPYPRVWVGNNSIIKIVFDEPFWCDVNLDTDLTPMPKAALTTLKYMLSRDLAEENGYTDIADRLDGRYKEAYADYVRSLDNSASPIPDFSAPGYLDGHFYNIELDGLNGFVR